MNEAELIENYLEGTLSAENTVLMEAKLLIHPELATHIQCQRQVYSLVKKYGRAQLRNQIRNAEKIVFSENRFELFRKRISSIFS